METRRRKIVSGEDCLTTTQRITRSKTRENGRREENALPMIPIDLIMEIFSRLPAKSIARCRSVSYPWASILRRSDFTELFSTRSSARPQFLFACKQAKKEVKKETVPVIYNPSTGKSLLLPIVKTTRSHVRCLLGYDAIDKQFKIFFMPYGENSNVLDEYEILTLGTGRNHSWRMIQCCRPHYSSFSSEGICIDGVLYYIASENRSLRNSMVVCFDVRSEKFSFIQVPETFIRNWRGILVNYNGKLGLFVSNIAPKVLSFVFLKKIVNNGRSIRVCCLFRGRK